MKKLISIFLFVNVVIFVLFAGVFMGPLMESDGYKVDKKLPKVRSAPPNPKALYDPIVQLIGDDGDFICTAVVFDSKYAVTASHCLDGRNFTIKDSHGNVTGVKAKRAGRNGRLDYGVITGDFSNFKWAIIDVYNNRLFYDKQDGPFVACGFPMGQKVLTCAPFKPLFNEGFQVAGISTLIPGQSGGPVIDRNGVVVAVNTAQGHIFSYVQPLVGLLGAMEIEP